jgi:hypothetical protein
MSELKPGIIHAADFLQKEVDRQKDFWREQNPALTEEYLNTTPGFAHVQLQEWVDQLRKLADANT